MPVHHVGALCLWKPEGGIESSGTGIRDSRKMPCGCWKLTPGALEKQPVASIVKLSLHPTPDAHPRLNNNFKNVISGQGSASLGTFDGCIQRPHWSPDDSETGRGRVLTQPLEDWELPQHSAEFLYLCK